MKVVCLIWIKKAHIEIQWPERASSRACCRIQHLNLIEGKSQYNHLFSVDISTFKGMLVACLNMLIGVKRIIGNWL